MCISEMHTRCCDSLQNIEKVVKKMKIIKANIRSRGPIINDVAVKYGGGGHIYASGARLTNWEDADNLIKDLDEVAKEYK